jgi:hypothetical protein
MNSRLIVGVIACSFITASGCYVCMTPSAGDPEDPTIDGGAESDTGWSAEPDAARPSFGLVCGEDGRTYVNASLAGAAGITVAHDGECEDEICEDIACTPNGAFGHSFARVDDGSCCGAIELEVILCGTIAGHGCPDGHYCELRDPGFCTPLVTDSSGVCIRIPEECPDADEPLCGCDGETYSSHCDLHMAQMQFTLPSHCEMDCTDADCDPVPPTCLPMPNGSCCGTYICPDAFRFPMADETMALLR